VSQYCTQYCVLTDSPRPKTTLHLFQAPDQARCAFDNSVTGYERAGAKGDMWYTAVCVEWPQVTHANHVGANRAEPKSGVSNCTAWRDQLARSLLLAV
jgi:hypothetical protein